MNEYDLSVRYMLSLIGVLCGLFFLFFLSACITLFKINLVKLRYQAIDKIKFDELHARGSLGKLLDNMYKVMQSLRLAQFIVAIGIGVLLIMGLGMGFRMLNFEIWESHFFVVILLLFIFVIGFYYSVDVFTTKMASGALNVRRLEGMAVWMLWTARILSPITCGAQYFALRTFSIFNVRIRSGKTGYLDLEFCLPELGERQVFYPEILNIIRNATRLPELDVSDILLPRSQIQYLELNESVEENLEKARRTGHTRFPLCQGGIDHCLGIIHIKDIFRFEGDMKSFDFLKFQRPLIKFEESTSVEVALKKLQGLKIHMALVADEFGGIIGLLTLEDILEELVGNIQDEFDHEDAMIIPVSKNTYKVSGLTPIHDLESFFNVKVDNDKVSTFGGLITATLGRIPEKNERIKLFCWSIRIVEVSKQRIISTIVREISNELGEEV